MNPSLAGALLRALAPLSLSALHRLGAALGRLLWGTPNRVRSVTEVNLALCYPRQSAAWRNATARASLVETGKSLAELAALWYWPLPRVQALLVKRSGLEHLEAGLAARRGVIVVLSHTGAWELAGQFLPVLAPITFMYRPPRRTQLEPLLTSRRERAGARLVPTGASGVRALYKALRAGEAVGLLPDQEPRQGTGVFAPFMGIEAYTMVLLSRLARRTGAPALMISVERLADAGGFHLHVEPMPAALYDADVARSARAVNQSVEQVVHRNPAQYMWSYKRFRRQPDGTRRRYRRAG